MAIAWPWGKTRRVRDALAAYPAFEPPHSGKGVSLTKSQRADNLAWFLASRNQRCEVLRETMAGLDYPLPGATPAPAAVEAASLIFHRLCHDHLIGWKLAREGLDQRRPEDPAAAGLDGFGRDIAILLCDAVLALRPALGWTVGMTRNMPTLGKIVIAPSAAARTQLAPFELDVLATGPYQLFQVADNGNLFKRPNAFSFAVDLVQGRYEIPIIPD